MKELIESVSKELAADRHEAEMVIASLLGRPRHELHFLDAMSDREQVQILQRVRQLKQGIPIEYLTRKVQFRDHVLAINPGVFIPRLETEQLIEYVRKIPGREPQMILEIGTGCGALTIALAFLFPGARIVATDISEKAIENAQENIVDHALGSRVELVRCDMYGGISGVFDLIVSNPPYIPRDRLGILPPSVKDFEPLEALDGGEQGVEFIEELIEDGQMHLAKDGIMAFEIDDDGTDLLRTFLEDNNIGPYVFRRDLFGRYRYLFIGVDRAKS
ncbi:peptide chain release factor N(5)-glutamine methyltransferase [candidate division WOR-3 bacterium]|nr:peptide chain release factor N(5)-glutamine methyltransferase [candidate division WOR-3 bacterium]